MKNVVLQDLTLLFFAVTIDASLDAVKRAILDCL